MELLRLEETLKGTLSALRLQKHLFCMALEPTDKLNKPEESCIPAQQYWCQRIISPKWGETFEVQDVPGRDHILFHRGNTSADTLGCIILGEHVGKLRGNLAVLNSGKTFEMWMRALDGYDTFHLTIREVY